MRALIIFLLLAGWCHSGFSQDRSEGRHFEMGLNMTGLLSQVLPFQQSSTLTGPFHFHLKAGRNNHFFSFKLGAAVSDFFDDDNFFNLSFGYQRRRMLSDRWDFNMGYNLIAIGGSFNDPVNSNRDLGGIGFGWDLGFQYHLNNSISLGTETTLFIGPTSDIFALTFVPPVGIFLNAKLK